MLSAEEARKRTNDALTSKTDLIKQYLKHIETKITIEIAKGNQEITHPFTGLPGSFTYPHTNIKNAVKKAIEANGYTWTEYADPDPGYPGSGPYSKISW